MLDKTEDFLVEIKGNLLGHMVEGEYSNLKINLKEEEKLKLKTEIFMILNPDLNSIEVFAKNKIEKMFELKTVAE